MKVKKRWEEILFRGKALSDSHWMYGNVVFEQNGEKAVIWYQPSKTADILGIDVDPNTVGEYTGKNDKSSIRIFEGDVVSDLTSGLLGIVQYQGCEICIMSFGGRLKGHLDPDHEYQQLGNIYD